MWNYFMVRDFYEIVKRKKWVLPVVHGWIDFKNLEDKGNKITLLLLARRSRHYAGTRYLRRGINQEGRPANFVEIEQILYRHQPCFNDAAPMMSSFV
jgi:phosphatidylinositol 3,5-bisphosphate 5-phosphatase